MIDCKNNGHQTALSIFIKAIWSQVILAPFGHHHLGPLWYNWILAFCKIGKRLDWTTKTILEDIWFGHFRVKGLKQIHLQHLDSMLPHWFSKIRQVQIIWKYQFDLSIFSKPDSSSQQCHENLIAVLTLCWFCVWQKKNDSLIKTHWLYMENWSEWVWRHP